jgi:hypothetical protein
MICMCRLAAGAPRKKIQRRELTGPARLREEAMMTAMPRSPLP